MEESGGRNERPVREEVYLVTNPLDSIPSDAKKRYNLFMFDNHEAPNKECERLILMLHTCKLARGDREWNRAEDTLLLTIQRLTMFLCTCDHAAVRMSLLESSENIFDALLTLIYDSNL
jgi:hypothetical protein